MREVKFGIGKELLSSRSMVEWVLCMFGWLFSEWQFVALNQ